MKKVIIAGVLAALVVICASCKEDTPAEPAEMILHAPPVLLSPDFGAIVGQPVTFTWRSDHRYEQYILQLDSSSHYSSPLVHQVVTDTMQVRVADLPDGPLFYWRVGGQDGNIIRWSATRECRFQYYAPPVILLEPGDNETVAPNCRLTWERDPPKDSYRVQVSYDGDFLYHCVVDTFVHDAEQLVLDRLVNREYAWRVGISEEDTTLWSETRTFTWHAPLPEGYSSCSLAVSGVTFLLERSYTNRSDTIIVDTISFTETWEYQFDRDRSEGTIFRIDEDNYSSVNGQFSVSNRIDLMVMWSAPNSIKHLAFAHGIDSTRWAGDRYSTRRTLEMEDIDGNDGTFLLHSREQIERVISSFGYSTEVLMLGERSFRKTIGREYTQNARIMLSFK